MNQVEVPEYFVCPISLQIMKDPVTTITGITYDRASIEQWLLTAAAGGDDSVAACCPVTNQSLPRDSFLTPNHNLRRLIQAWCIVNEIDRIPTPRSPLSKSDVSKLLRRLNYSSDHPDFIAALKKLESIVAVSDSSRNDKKCLIELGVATAMGDLLIRLSKEEKPQIGLGETLRILHHVLTSTAELKQKIISNPEIVNSITWVLTNSDDVTLRAHAVTVMRQISKVSGSALMERLNPTFFKTIVGFISNPLHNKATKAALRVLIDAAQFARNRFVMITEAGAVHALIELELGASAEGKSKKATELAVGLLAQLCACADGRERLLAHADGVSIVTKRLLRVSPAVDCAAVQILAVVARHSATTEVLAEMLKVGAVAKLCMLLQADCEKGLKDMAREVLRMHYGEWNSSACIEIYLVTKYPTLQF